MKDWKWNKDGKGCAGEYTKKGWQVWSNGSGWKITKPDGLTYAVEFKQNASAKGFAERRMK